ncbi:MAG: PPOX class F420-dependent oxidoreductase [Dehalococcoidia bacterium]|nr:PPOX class F420-dependent oxidoreductase [Dehalococcoidia bacterium]
MSSEQLSDRQRRFVEEPRIARLATVGRDGAPHIAPVWYRFADGAFLVLTDRGTQKHRNIERDPRVELCIDDERPPYHTVIVRGRASVEPAPGEAWRLALAIHYLGEEAGRRYVEANASPHGVLLRIPPERVRGW